MLYETFSNGSFPEPEGLILPSSRSFLYKSLTSVLHYSQYASLLFFPGPPGFFLFKTSSKMPAAESPPISFARSSKPSNLFLT